MARLKKSIPRDVDEARQRVAGMISINDNLDLGNGVSVQAITALIETTTDEIGEYNTMLSQIDQKSNEIDAHVKTLNDLTSRALKGTEFKYGRDSNEYEMIGGTRTSDRKKPVRKNGGGTEAVK